jgi:hypothetical protein
MRLSTMIFKTDDKTYRVEKKEWGQEEFERDYAYTMSDFNPYVYPYRGEIDNIEYAASVGLYTIKHGDMKIHFTVSPKNNRDRQLYNRDRIIPLTPEIILTKLKDDIGELDDIVMSDGDIFAPQIKHTDDIALAGMKYSIGKKQVVFNAYTDRFQSESNRNNRKAGLVSGKTLKMDMLALYGEVFDINTGLIFWDKEGSTHPMDKDGVRRVYTIFNGEAIQLDDKDIVFKEIERK